jgi:KDO2-lipid IV(A) lauroyltransferase
MAVRTDVNLWTRLEHAGFRFYLKRFAAMPLDKASDAGANWMVALGPLTDAHATALRNLRLAFPNETETWRRDVARAAWACVGRTFGEFPHLPYIHAYRENSRISVLHPERLDAIRESKKGAVFISGHFANWELMPIAIAQRPCPCQMTYRPMNNPLIDADVLTTRTGSGAILQAAKGKEGGMGLLRSLKQGVSVALMNDQKYNEGVSAPLFGHECMTADGPSRLALKFNVPLQPMSITRKGAYFTATVHEPMRVADTIAPEDAIRESVVRINQFMETHIRANPDQWFWVHKRWPKEAWIKAGAM